MNFNNKPYRQLIPEPFLSDMDYITSKIEDKGGECYLVGGSVRDLALNLCPEEYDLTTSLKPEIIQTLFKRVIETGIKHGTVTILIKDRSYEITTYRQDLDYIDGRRPEKIQFCSNLSQDLSRRDFTINAMVFNVLSEKFIDLHKGMDDLKHKVIRTIGNPIDRFNEDGLRAIRAIRFVGKLNFTLEQETKKAIFKTNHITKKISIERFHDELNKILFTKWSEKSLTLLLEEGIFSLFIPNIKFKKDIIDFSHIHLLPKSVSIRLCFFLFLSLENFNLKETQNYLKKLKYSNVNIKETIFYLSLIDKTKDLDLNSYNLLKNILCPLASFFSTNNLLFDINPYLKLVKAIFGNEETLAKDLNNLLEKKYPLLISDLNINGKIISENFSQIKGKKIGEILNHCLDFCLKFHNSNKKETLLEEISRFIKENL